MATKKLINSTLSGAFTKNTSISLWEYIQANWSTVTGYTVPAAALVKFGKKFGSFKGFYHYVVVESTNKDSKIQVLGQSRYENKETKRIQILSAGTNAESHVWNIGQHIESIINGNPTGMTSDGVQSMKITDFSEVNIEDESNITNLMPNKKNQTSRMFATIELQYDLEQVSV